MKIRNIELSTFRGSTTHSLIKFDAQKPISLIFGENGTGKSTIIDAFDFVCNGSIGSLGNYSITGSKSKYLVSHGSKNKPLVKLSCDDKEWQAVSNKDSIIRTPEQGCPDASILRRKTILDFIEKQPSSRYDALKIFLNAPNTEKAESAINDSLKETKKLYEESIRALTQANEALDTLWEQNGKNEKSAIAWAEKQIKADLSNKKSLVTLIDNLLNNAEIVKKSADSLLNSVNDENSALKTLKDALTKQAAKEEEQKGQDALLLSVLQKSREYIENHKDSKVCPVCGTTFDVEELLCSISDRISAMNSIHELALNVKNAQQALASKKAIKEQVEKRYSTDFLTFAEVVAHLPMNLYDILKLSDALKNNIKTFTGDSAVIAQEYVKWYDSFIVDGRNKLSEFRDSQNKEAALKESIESHLATVREKTEIAKNKEQLQHKLTLLLSIITDSRKEYIDNILSEISLEVAGLYSSLHPDEPIGNPHLYLKPKVKSSLEFDASFNGETGVPPQAYYSEAHLDTLGICVFIALSKHFKTDSTILILDDVLTSVDAQHLSRLIDVLDKETDNFSHIIIATHYRPLKDRYKYMQGGSSKIEVIELIPWSLTTGIQTTEFKDAISELREAISQPSFDRQIVASKSGILLESILDFLTLKYRCSIPRNDSNEFTLGELVGGFNSKLSKVLLVKKDGKDIPLKPLFDKAINKDWIRNQVGCHFNLSGSIIADKEVKEFATDVLNIMDTIICPECKKLPKKSSGSFLYCSKECKEKAVQLHPVQTPD